MTKKTAFDFDTVISRQGTGSRKWDGRKEVFGSEEVLPLWIADMDFAVPEGVTAHIAKRAEHPIYAYNIQEDSVYQAFIDWVKKRHGWQVEKDWILLAPGVVPSIIFSILALSKPGEGVIIQPPVYPPFFASIKDNERKIVENPLINNEGYYEIDFDDLEKKLADPANTLLLLCSPHNPVGRVWTTEELTKIHQLCETYKVDILSDEIHSDVIYSGHKHTVLANLGQAAAERTVTFMAASKTFNVAGLNLSFIVVPCQQRREQIKDWFNRMHMTRNNLFGVLAAEAAYREGEAWLDALLPYLEQNAATLVEFVQTRLPKIKVHKPEGTYLAWLDFRAYFTDAQELDKFLIQQAKVGLNSGLTFGQQGAGFARLNLATQRSILIAALKRIETAINALV